MLAFIGFFSPVGKPWLYIVPKKELMHDGDKTKKKKTETRSILDN